MLWRGRLPLFQFCIEDAALIFCDIGQGCEFLLPVQDVCQHLRSTAFQPSSRTSLPLAVKASPAPPKHFTEDLLLHAMETASADSMPEGVERQGIGTPATRAATIEKLVQKGFLERKGTKKTKVLLPTDKGKALITVMPEEIQSPEMTADWETKLLQIERGEMEPSEFMTEKLLLSII